MPAVKTHYPHLMQPIKVGNTEFKNRINFSPTFSFFATADNEINRDLIEWLRPIAAGGCNIVFCGTGVPNPQPEFVTHVVNLWNDSCINQLSMLFDTIHAYNCKAGMELMPIVPNPDPFDVRDQKGSAQIEFDPMRLTRDDIQMLIHSYADAAERVLKAGGDAIVFHAAHMQAPAAFFSQVYNHRTDEYGGDTLENRARFALESLEGIRARVGNKLLIEMRLSCSDMVPGSPPIEELIEIIKLLQDKIDWLQISRGHLDIHKLTPYVFPPLYFERGYNLEAAAQFKAALDIPVSCVGGMNYELGEKAVASGMIDMVEFSRPLLADSDIPEKLKYGLEDEIRPCIRCNNCIHRTHNFFLPIRCAVNPTQGRELLFNTYPAPKKRRKVAVVGGGPAGMQAAITAADRGHAVTLFEASDKLGGVMNIAAAPPIKADIKTYRDYMVRMTEKNEGVTLLLNTRATPELIEAGGFDAVIVAVGADPVIPKFAQGFDGKVVWVGDVETGAAAAGDTVVIAGAGMTGMECALTLANEGKKVTMIDMLPERLVGQGGTKMNIIALRQMLDDRKVEIKCETKLLSVTDAGILVSVGGEQHEIPCDTLVLSLGVRARAELARSFRESAVDVISVGDCATTAGTLMYANQTAFDAAMAIL